MVLGTSKQIVSARATDKQIQAVSQDGGIVSGLLSFALEEKIIEGAVVAGPGKELWKPEPMVAMTKDEIIAAAGTKYTFSPNVMMLKKAVRQCGLEKVGTVAIPCQTMGIRKMQSYPFGVRFLADKIKLLVIGTNLGGLGTLIASMASLISFKFYGQIEGSKKGKYIAVFSLLNIVFLIILMAIHLLISCQA